jgi:hypothetical protein
MKRGTPRHPKTTGLMHALGCSYQEAVGVLELLWHFTAEFAPAGDIGRWTNAQIAEGIQWAGEPDRLIEALVRVRWLEEAVPDRLRVHDWYSHADDIVHHVLARAGRRFVTGEVPRLGRFSKVERERLLRPYVGKRFPSAFQAHARALSKRLKSALANTNTKPSLKPSLAKPEEDLSLGFAAAASPAPDPFACFWAAYPKRRHKPDASRVWKTIGGDRCLEAILAGVERWKTSDAWRRGFIEDPARFLRQRQWEDEVAVTGDDRAVADFVAQLKAEEAARQRP